MIACLLPWPLTLIRGWGLESIFVAQTTTAGLVCASEHPEEPFFCRRVAKYIQVPTSLQASQPPYHVPRGTLWQLACQWRLKAQDPSLFCGDPQKSGLLVLVYSRFEATNKRVPSKQDTPKSQSRPLLQNHQTGNKTPSVAVVCFAMTSM